MKKINRLYNERGLAAPCCISTIPLYSLPLRKLMGSNPRVIRSAMMWGFFPRPVLFFFCSCPASPTPKMAEWKWKWKITIPFESGSCGRRYGKMGSFGGKERFRCVLILGILRWIYPLFLSVLLSICVFFSHPFFLQNSSPFLLFISSFFLFFLYSFNLFSLFRP